MARFKYTLMAAFLGATSAAAVAQDRFQWLEAPTDGRALDWARSQTKAAKEKIAAMPDYAAVREEMKVALAAGDPPPAYLLQGPYILRLQRSVDHPHGILAAARRGQNGAPGSWKNLLDIDALRAAEGKPYELRFDQVSLSCAPPDHSRCLFSLSPEGGDETELREFDIEAGSFVADGFRTPAARNFAAWFDKDHLLIEHSTYGAPTLPTGWPAQVSIWTRGEPLSAAKLVYTAKPKDALMLISATGEGANRVGTIARAIDFSTIEHLVVTADGQVKTTQIPLKLKMILSDTGGGRIFAQLGEAAVIAGKTLPAETIVAYNTASGLPDGERMETVYLPDTEEFIGDPNAGFAPGRSSLTFILNRRGIQRLVTITRNAKGWEKGASTDEAVGSSVSIEARDPGGDALVVKRSGYLSPNRLDLIGTNGVAAALFAEKPVFDASPFVIELKTAISKDSTEIDYFLLRPKDFKPGATPLLMTGYGAFSYSVAPGYFDSWVGGKSLVPWLKRGGALALPLIRGGGERGEVWHQAAIREKRQNSYDDFAAVTEAIVKSGLTSPKHIGVFGTSNGGLLAAVMGTQRSDLYGAIVSDAPLTDLARMPFMGMGSAWVNEYGDANDPAMLAVLNSYSPYQTVRPGRNYPPFLVTVATSDNRVGPGHARKLAARLEEVGSPVLYLEDQEGGHGVSDPLSRPDLMADRMTFLIDTLK